MSTVAEKTVARAARYETIETRENILVKVPLKNFMNWIDEHTFESADGPVSVSAHWQNGVFVHSNPLLIVNQHFYKIGEDSLGQQICTRVTVVKKTMPDGKEFIIRNIVPCDPNPNAPFLVMKFKKGADRGILIPGTDFKLQFNKTPPPK